MLREIKKNGITAVVKVEKIESRPGEGKRYRWTEIGRDAEIISADEARRRLDAYEVR